MDVAGHEEIEPAIAVVVAPGCAGGPVAEGDAGLLGYVGEGAVVVVVVEPILAEVGDIDVGPAVVVVVSDGHAEAPAIVADAGFLGHVGEGAVVIIVEERGMRRESFSIERGLGAAVHEIDIQPAIVVVIQEGDAGADAFEDVFLVGRTHDVMPFGQACLGGDVLEDDRASLDRATLCDGQVVRVGDRGIDAGCAGAAVGCGLSAFLRLLLLGFEWRRCLAAQGQGADKERDGEDEGGVGDDGVQEGGAREALCSGRSR